QAIDRRDARADPAKARTTRASRLRIPAQRRRQSIHDIRAVGGLASRRGDRLPRRRRLREGAQRMRRFLEEIEALFVQPRIFDGAAEAKLIALTCSPAPEGFARWSLRLLEEKVVELGIVEKVSDNTIGRTLKKTRSNRIATGNG